MSDDGMWFEDEEQLDELQADTRQFDTLMVSSREGARALVEEFEAREGTGVWVGIEREEVAQRLYQLIDDSRLIQQGRLNLCGPASLICMWGGRDPVGLVSLAIGLFETGQGLLGYLLIAPSGEILEADFNGFRAEANTWAADWMLLGAIRNSLNVWWQPEWVGDPDQELAGLTRPEELASWLEATGIYSVVRDEANWTATKGLPHALGLTQVEGRDIALLINANLLSYAKGQSLDQHLIRRTFPNHYVVLLNDVALTEDQARVLFSVWTYGRGSLMLEVPLTVFVQNYYGAVVASM